jgi:DNA-binding LytR/AlgR family response regulator
MSTYIRLLKRNLKAAEAINENILTKEQKHIETGDKLSFLSTNKGERLQIHGKDFLAAIAEGNYVKVYYKRNEEIKHMLLRSTLKKIIQETLNKPPYFRCHRAYIVNLDKVSRAEGNSQGFLLDVHDLDLKIPVSRSFVKAFKERFRS